MRTLFLCRNLPVPVNSGYAIRTLSLVRALAEIGYEIDFLSFGCHSANDVRPLSSLCKTVATVANKRTNISTKLEYLRRLAGLFANESYALHRFSSSEMRSLIESRLKTRDYDFVLADGLHGVINIPHTDVPIVLNCHNVEWLILERYAAVQRNLAKKVYARIEARRMREAERTTCDRIAVALACSKIDRALLLELRPELPIFVVPNCVDTDYITPNPTVSRLESEPTLIFQGVMDWYPNCDAVKFFANEIFPAIRREFPRARFVVAGRNPSSELRQSFAAIPGVEVTGTVADIRPYLSEASLVVVPLRIGSGTRLKILESAAAGKPIVSTSLGVEGLDFQSHKEIVIADEPDSFAQEVISLLRNPQRRRALGDAARERVVRRYSQEALRQALNEALVSVVGEPAIAGGQPND